MNASRLARSAAFSVRHAVSFGALRDELSRPASHRVDAHSSVREAVELGLRHGTRAGTPCRRAIFSSREISTQSPASLMVFDGS